MPRLPLLVAALALTAAPAFAGGFGFDLPHLQFPSEPVVSTQSTALPAAPSR
ncbi:hypothetical protein [Frigidibacter oleivorans]|uniref:hypothetical protein n=1 Tax=Frigidibacter oleivorans TaxID=2487129 RepID=UPI0013DEE1B0|nr:hypothetical protein [Frigidibacter oleivorans]